MGVREMIGRPRILASPWLPLVVVAALAAAFIARLTFVIDGTVFFSLYDDAMISMHYARNLAEGHGLVWNVGQPPVEGYSNFAWTLWMAALHLLGASPSKVSLLVMLSGALLLVLNVIVIRRVVLQIAPDARLAAPVAGWLVALDHNLAFWTLRGFEVGLITLEISLAVHLALGLVSDFRRGRLVLLAAVMALGVLTRDDTVPAWLVVSAYVGLCAPREHRRTSVLWLLFAVAATLGAHTVMRQLYYGAPLPNTYYLKMHGIPALLRWRRGIAVMANTALLGFPVPLFLAASLLTRRPRDHGALLLAALFLTQCAYSVHTGGDAFENEILVNRYMTYGLPSLCALAAMGLAALLQSAPAQSAAAHPPSAYSAAAQSASPPPPLAHPPSAHSPSPPLPPAPPARPSTGRFWNLAPWLLAGVVCAWNLRAMRLGADLHELRVIRMTAALGAAAIVTTLSAGRWPARSTALLGAMVVAMQGPAVFRWGTSNAAGASHDPLMVRYGLALGAATSPEATIAVTSAGAIPYFARRPAIDLMGKCDAVIARTPLHPGVFSPGHNRWDLAYSIGRLRPDVVAHTTEGDEELLRTFEAWGYLRIGPEVFVRRDSRVVHLPAARRAACTIPWDIEEIWGHFGDSAALWGERWRRECGALSGAGKP